jgi:hypothetical protein
VPPTCAYRAQAVQSVRGAWFFGHHLLSGLILPQALERGVPELAIGGPGSELDLGDEVRLNPLGQIASDVAGRPTTGKGRFVNLKRVKLLPELPRGRCRVPGAGTPDMRQLSVPILPENEGADCA